MLRNILYIDNIVIDDYVSQIEGYTYEEETIIDSALKDKNASAGIGIRKIKADGKIQKQNSYSTTKKVKITVASKLDKVIKYLESDNELKYYENMDEHSWNNINRNDFLELLVTPRFSKMREMSIMAKNINNMINVFQQYTENEIIDSKTKHTLSSFESISNLNNDSTLSCVFNFKNNQYPVVAKLNNDFFKIDAENIKSECYLLCKVQRKIETGKNIELDEVFDAFKNLNINREQKRKISKKLSNPKEIKDSVKGPAIIVHPIAIYR